MDRNSAPRSNQRTADKKNEKTKLMADKTGFDDEITLIDVNISKALKIKKVINSMFIWNLYLYL